MATKSYGRAAAWTAAVILCVLAGFQFYWGLGGTWGFHEVLGGKASGSNQIDVVIMGLVDLASAGVLLARVGYWRERVPFAIARIGAWVIAITALAAALRELAGHADFRLVSGSVLLIIAVLAVVVARSELPTSSRSGAAPTPSRKPGPPTPAH